MFYRTNNYKRIIRIIKKFNNIMNYRTEAKYWPTYIQPLHKKERYKNIGLKLILLWYKILLIIVRFPYT